MELSSVPGMHNHPDQRAHRIHQTWDERGVSAAAMALWGMVVRREPGH